VPTGRAINPVTKTNWEGTGVKPDVEIAADRALDSALTLARSAADAHRKDVAEINRAAREELSRELARAEGLFAQKKNDEAKRVVADALEAARSKQLVEEGLINMLGYDYMGRREIDIAIAIFEYNTTAFPNSGNTYDSLGEALMNAGDARNAIANYRRSLELDPSNNNAKAMIERMENAKQ
jgi:tetratricopeptide (TPR) repeat protein